MEAIGISDADLGTLACAGDVQTLAGLLERCRPSLYAAAIRLLGNRADAADAVQDTFVIALLRLGGLRQAGAARAWLTLLATAAGSALSHDRAQAAARQQWTEFYREVHDRPVPRTYRELFLPDVDVRDPAGQWHGIGAWSAEEREAISVGVRATIIDVLASRDITIIEIDFRNPAEWPDHCPPHATFVHRLAGGRSRQLRIHYPAGAGDLVKPGPVPG